jgi:conjugative transposon TraN protein
MKQFVCLVCVCVTFLISKAQSSVSGAPALFITTNKTTSLIFPSAIKHVDRGTKDVLVQQVKEAENLLLVKASSSGFKETNLSVVTADGHLYTFDVCYDSVPLLLVYRLSVPPVDEKVSFQDEIMNIVRIEDYAKSLLNNKKSVRGIRSHKWDMTTSVNGIYIKDNVMFYQLVLKNESAINYDIEFIRFYIRDKKKGKRTATQEVELKPLCTSGKTGVVNGMAENSIVLAFEKFTIPEAKFLAIEVMENNGGRHLLLKVRNNKIVRARLLPEPR